MASMMKAFGETNPVLDGAMDQRHRYRMRTICAVMIMMAMAPSVRAQAAAPLEVVNSAITAVNDMGRQMVLGKLKTSLERMYPQWKDRLIQRVGGEKALDEEYDQVRAEMMKQGTSIISFKTYGFPRVHEVYPGKKVEVIDGKEVETLINTKWLLLVPTEVRYRVVQNQEVIVIESKGFQVAIADKDKLQWSFIDGGGMTVQDLRSLFISLPQDMKLPEIQRRTVPKDELQQNR
jgi:hypothetical protein